MKKLTNEHIMIARILLEKINSGSGRGEELITYKELSDKLNNLISPRNFDSYLGDLSQICKDNGLPLISVIVVNSETRFPGAGFYKYFFAGSNKDETEIFIQCYNQVVKFKTWYKLNEVLNIS